MICEIGVRVCRLLFAMYFLLSHFAALKRKE